MSYEDQKAGTCEQTQVRRSGLLTFSRSHLLFFVLCFVYLWRVVEPHLIYHGFGTILPDAPLFATGWPFLTDALGMPGGPVAYAAGFLSQGYYYSWLGAAIIVLTGFGLGELARRHLVTAGLAHASAPAGIPVISLFLIYSHYKHPLPAVLAVSLGLVLSLLFERLPLRHPLVRAAACCLLAAAGFWLGGGGTLLVFAILTVAYEVFVHRDWRTIALALPAIAAITWILAEYVFLIPARPAFLILTPFAPPLTAGMSPLLKILMFLLYGFVPVAVLLVLRGSRLLAGRVERLHQASSGTRHARRNVARASRPCVSPASCRREKNKGKMPSPRAAPPPPKRPTQPLDKTGHATARRSTILKVLRTLRELSAVPIALMALGVYFSQDEFRKPYVLSNYYSHQRQWDKLVELNNRLPKGRTNVFVNHDFLRALYHTGRLPYDMFRCPLIPEAILLTHEKGESDLTQWKLSDIFLELGHVNMAQKLASELAATKGHLGIALETLGWISLIKGNPGAARVYLEALKRDPIRRARAQSLLRGLDSGWAPGQAASIDTIRSHVRNGAAAVTGREPVDETLAALLEHNPRNQMAFEYLMACHLLTGRVEGIARNVDRLKDLGYERIPTLYEEAILIYNETTAQTAHLHGYRISQESHQRYEAFVQVLSVMQTPNRQAAFHRLIREFGTSYFFYYSFGRVGLM